MGDKYFSLFLDKQLAINIEMVNNQEGFYNIFYLTPTNDKIHIVAKREAPNVFVVLYNYSMKLKLATELLDSWNRIQNDIDWKICE